jgi:outer membrane protein assembly factor BamE (lipoprotein component of BamABCDE complex)
MNAMQKILALILATLLMAGCAGTKFERPTGKDIELGATTKAQTLEKFGKPYSEAVQTKNGNLVTVLAYAYASFGETAKVQGVTPVHATTFHFFNDRLIGYEYVSTLTTSSTDFNDSVVSQIKKDQTTRAKVLDLLGKPSGERIFPLLSSQESSAWLYQYSEMRGLTPSRKSLVVTFDKLDVVSDIEFTKLGTFGN